MILVHAMLPGRSARDTNRVSQHLGYLADFQVGCCIHNRILCAGLFVLSEFDPGNNTRHLSCRLLGACSTNFRASSLSRFRARNHFTDSNDAGAILHCYISNRHHPHDNFDKVFPEVSDGRAFPHRQQMDPGYSRTLSRDPNWHLARRSLLAHERDHAVPLLCPGHLHHGHTLWVRLLQALGERTGSDNRQKASSDQDCRYRARPNSHHQFGGSRLFRCQLEQQLAFLPVDAADAEANFRY